MNTDGFPVSRSQPARAALLALALAASVAGCSGDGDQAITTSAGELTFEVALRTDPPRQQDNLIEVTVRDRDGRPVEGARVEISASMPAMAGAPAMRSRAGVEPLGGGLYRGELDLAMGGTWGLDVSVESSAGEGSASYSLTVGARGLQATGAAVRSTETTEDRESLDRGTAGGEATAYYSCSMHTHVRSADPGTCPICSMDLVAVTRREVETGEIVIDPMRRQTIGVRTGPVERRPLRLEVRAVGKVAYDETRLSEVSLKYPGWIGRLHVNATGQAVRRGDPLFTIYSPELHAAQGEYLAALESQRRARATGAPERADYLVAAARERLRLWDLRDVDLETIAASGRPLEQIPVVSPVSGHVIEKNVVAGAAVEAGMMLYRIAALDRVWVEAEVYESDLAAVRVGQRASVTLPNLPGKALAGEVTFLYPYLDDATRTGRVRIELPNPGLELKPAMYAEVTFEIDRGEALLVPESAVLYAGERRLVFLDLGGGRLKPQPIEVGAKTGDWVEVLGGLAEGDVVVTSGTFLVAAESRLKSATEQWQ